MLAETTKESSPVAVFHSTPALPHILSIGYEKRSTSEFLGELLANEIEVVVDVRQSAFSRRLDFRKHKLITLLDELNIEYFHLKAAGNPFRRLADTTEECLAAYHNYLSSTPDVVCEIAEDFKKLSLEFKRLAVICYERCPGDCHRTIVLSRLADNGFRFVLKEISDDPKSNNRTYPDLGKDPA